MIAKFSPGLVVATQLAAEAMMESGQDVSYFLDRHLQVDWGDVGEDDWKANDESVLDGSRILSAYRTLRGVKLWVITDAEGNDGHRTVTTVLLPEEY